MNNLALGLAKGNLGGSHELNRLKGSNLLKKYFFNQLICELDKALVGVRPTTKNPFPAEGEWLIVGIDKNFDWLTVEWTGHYYLHKAFWGKINKSDRRRVEGEIKNLAAFLGRLSLDELKKLLRGIELF